MELGYFAMPSHPPECGLKEGHDFDLQVLRWLDELGYQEAWIGEHHTAPWEPHPAPDLLLAQAFLQTKNIRLGPGGFLLPYHHPAELANRVAVLDHLSGGRLNFGVAASGLPSDWAMYNVDGMSGDNREMTREALDIILRLWTEEEPFDYPGKFWKVTKTGTMLGTLKPHLKPLQTPHPPIGSPQTVVQRLEQVFDEVGGFGTLLLFCFDYSGNSDAWYNSMRLLAEEVMPKVKRLVPKAP